MSPGTTRTFSDITLKRDTSEQVGEKKREYCAHRLLTKCYNPRKANFKRLSVSSAVTVQKQTLTSQYMC